VSRDRASALVWLIVAILVAFQSVALKLGTLARPGPGFFPFWGAVVLAVLSLVLFVGSRTTRPARPGPAERSWTPLVVAGALLAYVLLLEPLGFGTVTFLFLLLLFRLVRKPWLAGGLAALAGAAASHVLFQVWLKTQLPRGPFGF